MKIFAKLLLVIALFSTGALADDGHTGSGGRKDCTVNCSAPCTQNCPGSFSNEENGSVASAEEVTQTEEEGYFLEYVTETFWAIFG